MLQKVFIILVIFLLGGVLGRYLFPLQKTGGFTVQQSRSSDAAVPLALPQGTKEKVLLKLDLLKDYQNFIFLSKEEIKNPVAYANEMEKKAQTIGDAKLLEMYYATGEIDNKEKKITDYLNALIDSIKNDLSQ